MRLGLAIYHSLSNAPNSLELLLEVLREVDTDWFAGLRVVAVPRPEGPHALFYCEAVVSPEAKEGPHMDLRRMVVASECLRMPDFIERIEQAGHTQRLACGGLEIDVSQAISGWRFERHPSGRWFSHWPCFVATGNPRQQDDWVGPCVAVVDGKTLYFNNGYQIVEYITTLSRFHGPGDARVGTVTVIIEDRRARILGAVRDGETLIVQVDGLALEGLVLAGHVRDGSGQVTRFSEPVQPEVRISLPSGPVELVVGIADGVDVIDDRDRISVPSFVTEQAESEQPEHGIMDIVEQVRKLLNNGEDAHCELKPWVTPSRGNEKFKEVINTAVAMANVEGGHIILGVDDSGVPLPPDRKILGRFLKPATNGVEDDGGEGGSENAELQRWVEAADAYGKKVRDEVRKGVEPSVDFDCQVVVLDAVPLILAYVGGGVSPPYMVTDTRLFYVRRSATNRRVSREEIMALCLRGLR